MDDNNLFKQHGYTDEQDYFEQLAERFGWEAETIRLMSYQYDPKDYFTKMENDIEEGIKIGEETYHYNQLENE
ncbi:MAG: hypothetical protein LIR50_01145 [Bacillota bacterium]|nr:hypothetical protein [Bacillota bacterium]